MSKSCFVISLRRLRGSSSRAVLIAGALLVAALLPGTAAAAPEPGLLVVEGSGGTTVDVRIDSHPVVVNGRPEVRGGSAYAGAVIEPVAVDAGPTIPLVALQVRAFRDSTSDPVAASGIGRLSAGTYRVTLLGDGPVRVAWQLREEDAGVRIVPTRRLPVSFFGRAELLPGPGESAARVDLPGTLPAQRRALQVVLLDGEAAGDLRMCATTAADCPGQPLPACPPSPAPCRGDLTPQPYVNADGEPTTGLRLHEPASAARALRWSFDGYRLAPDRLRAAAVVF